jgi:hypothetical protein
VGGDGRRCPRLSTALDTGERFLDARAVADRYGISDPRAARKVMRATGAAFTVARRLVVPLDALRAWERAQQARERGEGVRLHHEPPNAAGRPRRRPAARAAAARAPGFWRG